MHGYTTHIIDATEYTCIYLSYLLEGSETNNRNDIGIRFLDLSCNRLSEGNCARILAGALSGSLEGLELGMYITSQSS